MADNVQSNATTTAGAVFATDEIAGINFPRVKPAIGDDGVAVDISTSNPMPVRPNDGSNNQTFAELDLDSSGSTVNRISVGIALPGSGGPVAGGTAANPIVIDPSNNTPMVVTGVSALGTPVGLPPLITGGRANGTGDPTAVTDGDATYVWMDLYGRQITTPYFPALVPSAGSHGPTAYTVTASGNTTIITAPGAESLHILSIRAVNSDATNDALVQFKDETLVRTHTFLLKNAVNNFSIDYAVPWKLPPGRGVVVNLSAAANVLVTIHYYIAG